MEKTGQFIKFKHNLQILRKRAGLSQEGLAEKMDISRQSVSKWESGDAYPEMKMLLALCDLFHIGLDELVHGDVEAKEDTPLRQKYGRLVHRRAILVPVGIGLILVGAMVMLALQSIFNLGETNFEPLTIVPLLILIAIAVVLFVIVGIEGDDFKRHHNPLPNLYTRDKVEAATPRTRCFIAGGIGVIILGVAVMMTLLAFGQDGIAAAAAVVGLIAIGVPLIIHGGIMKDSYDIEKYNQENSAKSKSQEEKIGAVSGIIMMLATIIYLVTGFAFDLWDTTWWVFPVGGILCGIASVIIKAKK